MAHKDRHPLELQKDCITREGVIVIENVKTLPSYGEPYVSPHLVVCLNHQGHVKMEYDMRPAEFGVHDISVVYPNHSVVAYELSPDYCATLVVVSDKLMERLRNRSTYRNHLLYLNRPQFHLTDEQYDGMMKIIEVMKIVCNVHTSAREGMLENLLDVFSQVVDEYRAANMKEGAETDDNPLFARFCDAIAQHYKESREVSFYARLMCLSPKYFAVVIKRSTGLAASDWISNYVVIQARSLLINRRDMSIQQISNELGFPDQATFSRYFKNNAGLSPKDLRKCRFVPL